MEMKKQKIVSAVATMGLILILFGATYAYFAARGDAGKITDVEITANTVDVLTFEIGDPITLSLDQESFAEGTGNKTGSTFAKATLTANNKTNTATEHYYLYLSISNNTFTYSKDSDHPEILVKITDPDGNELIDSDVEGLTHKTVVDAKGNTVTGFDVTDKEETITILKNREITTTSTTEEKWIFAVTFVNYDYDQSSNAGGNFSARVLIKKNGAILSDVCKSGDNLSECIIAMHGIEDDLYYHNGTFKSDDGTVIDANDNSYRYAGGEHPDYYSCSYNDMMVLNSKNYNFGNRNDCDGVYEINFLDRYIDASIEAYFDDQPVFISWDSEYGACLTAGGNIVYQFLTGFVNFSAPVIVDRDFCTGVAYQNKINGNYYAGIEKVGVGTETLYDSDNNLYACEYNGVLVANLYNEYYHSLQGDCSSIYKISFSKQYIDKSYQYRFAESLNVEWDPIEGFCKTINGDYVYDLNDTPIFDSSLCTGIAYHLGENVDYYSLGVVEVGTGNATLYEKAAEVNNYVCFGSDAATCPDDNLYRIIGVFGDQVKLIKWDYATSTLLGTDGDSNGVCADRSKCNSSITKGDYNGNNTATSIGVYWWNHDGTIEKTNTWSASKLNTVNLNTNFLNNIGKTWASKIATTTWKVGGVDTSVYVPATFYINEVTNPSTEVTSTYDSKVGLMYASDYGFAANPSLWATALNNYQYSLDFNWMYMGLEEWSIVRRSGSVNQVYYVFESGAIHNKYLNEDAYLSVRPVFYLNSDVTYVSGSGTKSNPIIIN